MFDAGIIADAAHIDQILSGAFLRCHVTLFGAVVHNCDSRRRPQGLAGFVLQGIDYVSARSCMIESRKSTPDDAGLGWTVDRTRLDFVGAAAMENAAAHPSKALVGLEVDLELLEALHEREGLPLEIPPGAHRERLVLTRRGSQVGQATSRAWSPLLKKMLALGTVSPEWGALGTRLEMDAWVDERLVRVAAEVVSRPFFDPPRKKA